MAGLGLSGGRVGSVGGVVRLGCLSCGVGLARPSAALALAARMLCCGEGLVTPPAWVHDNKQYAIPVAE